MDSRLVNYFQNYKQNHRNKVSYFNEVLTRSPVDFFSLIEDAFEMTTKEASSKNPNFMGRNYMAVVMNGNMVGLARERYPDLLIDGKYDRSYLQLDANLRVYLKKLNDDNLPMNIETDIVDKMNSCELFEGDDQVHVLYAGPNVKSDWSAINDSYILNVNDYIRNKIEWIEHVLVYRKDEAKRADLRTTKDEEQLVKVPLVKPGKRKN